MAYPPLIKVSNAHLAQVIYPRDQRTPESLHALQKARSKKAGPIIKTAGI